MRILLALLIMCAVCKEEIKGLYYEMGLSMNLPGILLIDERFGNRLICEECLEQIDYDMLLEVFEGYVFYGRVQ